MEFEVLKKNHLKRNIVVGVVLVFIISAIILNFTRAKYRVSDSVPIINSKINYKVPDLNMVSVYIANEEGTYEEADIIPTSGYTLNTEQSYCGVSNNGEIIKDENVTLTYESGSMTFGNVTKKGTKCYLYFDIEKETSGESILTNYPTVLTRTDFSMTVTDTTTGTIYYADTSKGRTYYFAGNPTDNWVQFAGFYWRIIRINENGSIRLIYNGTGTSTTGTGTQIQTSAFNNSYTNNMHVGYMYQSNQVHGLSTDSVIKGVLDTWYRNNLQSYADKISRDAGFCGDRTPYSRSGSQGNYTYVSGGGTGTTSTFYGAYTRLTIYNVSKVKPTFECQNESDLYTVVNNSQGNRALDYPIGLITADEVVYSGGVFGTSNINYYLYTDQDYWTMTPAEFTGGAVVFPIYSKGTLGGDGGTDSSFGVRPVINLSSDVTITGSGTSTDPYIVS